MASDYQNFINWVISAEPTNFWNTDLIVAQLNRSYENLVLLLLQIEINFGESAKEWGLLGLASISSHHLELILLLWQCLWLSINDRNQKWVWSFLANLTENNITAFLDRYWFTLITWNHNLSLVPREWELRADWVIFMVVHPWHLVFRLEIGYF